ncbi:MAG: alkaline phosphatase [Bacteroidaceae bacterium]|nr:alkaline phosphatase [Bacteroidaceae bacterium]
MKRRESLKLLGSIPFLTFGGTSLAGCNDYTKDGKGFAASPKNIVLFISDGMGVAQWQAGAIANGGKLNVGKMTHGGLMTTNPCDKFCGDAPSHCTALACGVNSHQGAVGVDKDNNPVKNIIELAKEAGLATGIVSSNTLVEGSNVSFIGHAQNRMMTEQITAQYVDTGVDVFIGAGEAFFTNSVKGFGPPSGVTVSNAQVSQREDGNAQQGAPRLQGGPGAGGAGQMTFEPRSDGRDLLGELRQKGWQVCSTWDDIKQVKSGKLAGFTNKVDTPNLANGRDKAMYPDEVSLALDLLSQNDNGFFLLTSSMFTDRASHNGKTELLCQEAINMDEAIGRAIDFADEHGDTLVLVAGSPEASGMTIVGGDVATGQVEAKWTMPGMANHSGVMVPYFAYGAGAAQFVGAMLNTELFFKMKTALDL